MTIPEQRLLPTPSPSFLYATPEHKKGQIRQIDHAISGMAHTLSAGNMVTHLIVQSVAGITTEDALQRSLQFGPNQLPAAPTRRASSVFSARFKSVLILVLAAATDLSALVGNIKDAAFVPAVMLVDAAFGFHQE